VIDLKTTLLENNSFKSSVFYTSLYAEVFVLGPHSKDQVKCVKIKSYDPETKRFEFDPKDFFTFKLMIFRDKVLNDDNYLDDYEVQIVVKEVTKFTEKAKVIGSVVLELSDVLNGAIVWKKLIAKDKDFIPNFNHFTVYGCLDLWLNLRSKLKIDNTGQQILRVLEKHKDKYAVNFVNLKSITREC
jgi:hypothetical protein